VKACPKEVLGPVFTKDGSSFPPWHLKLSISNNCISTKGVVCHICPEKCDAGAIRFTFEGLSSNNHRKPVIDQKACTGCGACIAPCPVNALSLSPLEQSKAA
jgi:ferredoxin-type protein NapF